MGPSNGNHSNRKIMERKIPVISTNIAGIFLFSMESLI